MQPSRPCSFSEGPRAGGFGRKATRQPIRARPAFGRLDEDAYQLGARVRDWRVYRGDQDVRRAHYRVLRRRSTDLHGAHTKRLYPSAARATVQAVPPARNGRMSVREFTGTEQRAMWTGFDQDKDGRLPLAQASPGRTIRVLRMDDRQSSSAHQIHRTARRQVCSRCQTRIAQPENPGPGTSGSVRTIHLCDVLPLSVGEEDAAHGKTHLALGRPNGRPLGPASPTLSSSSGAKCAQCAGGAEHRPPGLKKASGVTGGRALSIVRCRASSPRLHRRSPSGSGVSKGGHGGRRSGVGAPTHLWSSAAAPRMLQPG